MKFIEINIQTRSVRRDREVGGGTESWFELVVLSQLAYDFGTTH